ncbi:MAG TPA: Fic family protein [Pyrinomonadaceae bacterium]|nr:Fic family protein [Pyrinomonadaceae bacterium]
MQTLEKAEKLKAELDAHRPLDREAEARIMQKFRLDWNYHSNNLEGNSLTYGETKALILFGITAQGKPLKDHFEITGHNEAINWILEIVKDEMPLNEKFIRELHTLLLKKDYFVDAETFDGKPTRKLVKVGSYKTTPNHVKTKTGEIFYFANPEETPAKMHDLINWFRKEQEKSDANPIILAALFHYRFILIHPFDDGNGRTARILMNFILMQFGYPPAIIKTEDKENYYAVLRLADAGELEPFIEYITENLIRSLEIMIRGAKGESIEELDDLDKELALLEGKLKSNDGKNQQKKNPQLLKQLTEQFFFPLIREFVKICAKFDRFYLKNEVWSISVNQIFDSTEIEVLISKLRNVLIDILDLSKLRVEYDHKDFFNPKFPNISYNASIYIEFRTYSYLIKIRDNAYKTFQFEKSYSEAVLSEEFYSALREISKSHKTFIEQKTQSTESSP